MNELSDWEGGGHAGVIHAAGVHHPRDQLTD